MSNTGQATTRPELSVVVCTSNRYRHLHAAVESLRSQSLEDGHLEIIVVDNSGDQAGVAAVSSQFRDFPELRYLLEPEAGLSKARNAGVRAARSQQVAFIDDDVVAKPGWAAAIVTAFRAFAPRIGVVGGPVRPIWEAPPPAWLGESARRGLSLIDWGGDLRPLANGEWLAGCNIAFDRSLLLQAGDFRSDLGRGRSRHVLLSNEETEMVGRLQAAGALAVYAPAAVVEHTIHRQRLRRSWQRRRAAWQAVSDFLMDPNEARRSSQANRQRLEHRLRQDPQCIERALALATESAAEFEECLDTVYGLVLAGLAGGLEEEPADD